MAATPTRTNYASHAPIEMADSHRAQSLQVPPMAANSSAAAHARSSVSSFFSPLQAASQQPSQCASRLAPIEMMAPSIHMVFKAGVAAVMMPTTASSSKHSGGQPHHCQPSQKALPATLDLPRAIPPPLWFIPVGYVLCAAWFSTCTLMAPGYLHVCGHTLCPAWTCVLLCHSAAFLLVWGDSAWACYGLLVACLFPCVVVLSSAAVVALYLLVFAAFASGCFWRTLHGPAFLAACVCWFALLSGFILSLCVREHVTVQLGVMGLFALTVACIASACSLRKFSLLATVSHGA